MQMEVVLPDGDMNSQNHRQENWGQECCDLPKLYTA